MNIIFKKLYSSQVKEYEKEFGELRIKIFREFPYLYEGTLEYERKYLHRYIKAPNSLLTLALDNGKVIGATTCLLANEEDKEFKNPLESAGFDIKNSFYFGESIILPEYRGQGIGKKFFSIREAHAQETLSNLEMTCFCAVNREGHPLTPKNYRPLNDFWTKMGYSKASNIRVTYSWKDIDKDTEDPKELIYWIKKW